MNFRTQKGFTLVELMIALLLSSLVLISLGVAFQSQQESYTAQEEVAEMQQELRAGLEIITREIRNAGHDMTPNKTAGAGFVVAGPFRVQFTMDITGAGGDPDGDLTDADEDVTYALSGDANADGQPDAPRFIDVDGIANGGAVTLARDTGGGLQDLVTGIHALGFAYSYSDGDGDNNGVADGLVEMKPIGLDQQVVWAVPNGAGGWTDLDTNNDGIIDANDVAPVSGLATAAQRDDIRAVRIWILARSSRPDPDYTDGNTYKVGANVIAAPNDNFRRRLLTANVRCRNMGIVIP